MDNMTQMMTLDALINEKQDEKVLSIPFGGNEYKFNVRALTSRETTRLAAIMGRGFNINNIDPDEAKLVAQMDPVNAMAFLGLDTEKAAMLEFEYKVNMISMSLVAPVLTVEQVERLPLEVLNAVSAAIGEAFNPALEKKR